MVAGVGFSGGTMVAVLPAAIAVLAALPGAGQAGAASLPSGCSQDVLTVTCEYTASTTFVVPAGVTSIDVTAVGAPGADSGTDSPVWTRHGGRGAEVAGTLAVTPGEGLSVQVDVSGGAGGVGGVFLPFSGGGDGGGKSSVGTAQDPSLLVAGGGGGGGGIGGDGGDAGTGPGTCNPGRAGDDGAGPNSGTTIGGGGIGGECYRGGQGGEPDFSVLGVAGLPGADGTADNGGDGADSDNQIGAGGGGGGAGFYGGGGGASGDEAGGGGGGTSTGPAGSVFTLAPAGSTARVVISYRLPAHFTHPSVPVTG